jgi:hypothetical protein
MDSVLARQAERLRAMTADERVRLSHALSGTDDLNAWALQHRVVRHGEGALVRRSSVT